MHKPLTLATYDYAPALLSAMLYSAVYSARCSTLFYSLAHMTGVYVLTHCAYVARMHICMQASVRGGTSPGSTEEEGEIVSPARGSNGGAAATSQDKVSTMIVMLVSAEGIPVSDWVPTRFVYNVLLVKALFAIMCQRHWLPPFNSQLCVSTGCWIVQPRCWHQPPHERRTHSDAWMCAASLNAHVCAHLHAYHVYVHVCLHMFTTGFPPPSPARGGIRRPAPL